MKPADLLERIERGEYRNVRFRDLERLLKALGFRMVRERGSHRIWERPGMEEMMNVQPEGGQAKAYQLRQLKELVERYHLALEDHR